MPAVRTARKRIHRSPIGPVPGKPQRPAIATKTALLKGMKSLPPPVLSPSLSAIPWTLYSPDSISRVTPTPIIQQKSHLPIEVGLPVNRTPSPSGKGDGDLAKRGFGAGETSSMRLTRELQAALEEAEKARRRDGLDEDESTASSVSWRTKRSNRRAVMTEKAEKAARSLAPGRKVLRGKRAGMTKNKKAARKQKASNKGAELELDDSSMPDSTISPEGGSTDASMKDPSPGSGNVSMGDACENSPEDGVSGNKAETQRGMSAMGMVRRIGRHLGIFIAAAQDCTSDLRESGEYKAWRDFLGKL